MKSAKDKAGQKPFLAKYTAKRMKAANKSAKKALSASIPAQLT